MTIGTINDIDRLKRISQALMARVEQSMDQQGNAFSLFQAAINLEGRVAARTEELRAALWRLENTNNDLVLAKQNAEIANLSKTRFLAAASHDILQPLNAARLSVSALQELQTSDEAHKLALQVERSLETMEELLLTLLDISKLDAGVIEPQISHVPLEAIFQSLHSDFAPLAQSKGLRLGFWPTKMHVLSDAGMYRRILQNIISNAIHYTEKGGILVLARKRGGNVRIDVIDTGSGMKEDMLEEIFEEFHRGPNSRVGNSRGLGLGLSIVKRLVAALDHQLNVTSVPGKGSIFRLYAPIITEPLPHDHNTRDIRRLGVTGFDGLRVLIVENDENVSQAMITLLKRWGCHIRHAASKRGALYCIHDAKFEPDIILADQHLDGGDLGTDTIVDLRNALGERKPALVITADFSDELAMEAHQQDMEIMRKPVKPAQLRALMSHMLN